MLCALILALGGALSAAPAFDSHDFGGSLDREEAYGWARDPSLLAQGPSWRVGVGTGITTQTYRDQGFNAMNYGGDLIWGMGSLGSLGLAYHQMETADIGMATDLPVEPFRGDMARLGWGWAAGQGFSLGSGVAFGHLRDALAERSLTSADLGVHWTRSGHTLGAQAAYSNPGGQSQLGFSGHGALHRWLGYHWLADWDQSNGASVRIGLDTRTAVRFLVSYGGGSQGEGLIISLGFSWHGGHLAAHYGDRLVDYGLSWQAYTPSQAGPEAALDTSPPAIPDVDPAPTAPLEPANIPAGN